ncbi:MAG: acyl carrier protein [Sporomusaceae bacterium]|nr:acyl carrier protein [Sporomusaceae bacterium]
MNTLDKLQTVFQEVFDDANLTITGETTAADIAEWDSIAHIRLVIAVEEAFEIRFALGELQSLQNVGEMLVLIEEKLA